jgi:ArsR family transcriptional regulator, arsenate/arsenite/antimonite-responsive transcriptional repressor
MTTPLPVVTEPLCCDPVLEAPLSSDEAETLAAAFRAVADPVRLRLLSLVAASGEACVCDLPALVDRSQPTVSHHLKILHEAGLVTREQRGRWSWWSVVPERVAALQAALAVPTTAPTA